MPNRLRELRQERKMSLRELAENVNMSFSNLGSIERGEVQLREDTAKIFADFFDVSIDFLMGNSSSRKNSLTSSSPKDQLKGVKLALFDQVEDLTDDQAQQVLDIIKIIKKE